MRDIYALSRHGGAASPRFLAYRAVVESTFGLSAYNPMAGDHARATVDALLAVDAEQVAGEAAASVARDAGHPTALTLAIVVASPGLWTDRVGTEVLVRTTGERVDGMGTVLFWAREPVTAEHVVHEARAEAVRALWTAVHGPARTVRAVLEREGLASAVGGSCPDVLPSDDAAVSLALEVYGESSVMGEIGAAAFGDAIAAQMGWAPLGVPDRGGLHFAAHHAARLLRRAGLRDALHTTRWLSVPPDGATE
jgi:hypothetical protein